ncbi:hypothetical protein DOY81_006067, partial [Sarcophaga bullata]
VPTDLLLTSPSCNPTCGNTCTGGTVGIGDGLTFVAAPPTTDNGTPPMLCGASWGVVLTPNYCKLK